MQQLHASLNAASSSAKQVDGLRILLRRVALILGNNVPLYVIMATWGTLRALTGTVVSAGLALGFALPMSVFTPFFEYSRLKPARRARATRIVPVSPAAAGTPTSSESRYETCQIWSKSPAGLYRSLSLG